MWHTCGGGEGGLGLRLGRPPTSQTVDPCHLPCPCLSTKRAHLLGTVDWKERVVGTASDLPLGSNESNVHLAEQGEVDSLWSPFLCPKPFDKNEGIAGCPGDTGWLFHELQRSWVRRRTCRTSFLVIQLCVRPMHGSNSPKRASGRAAPICINFLQGESLVAPHLSLLPPCPLRRMPS